MRALVATAFGGPEVVAVIDLDSPAPRAGQVAVRVHAAGVNPTDLAVRAGWMQPYFPTTPPVVLGLDLAGTVAAVGEDVVDLQPGDAVVGHTLVEAMRAGTFAEYVVADRSSFVGKPEGLDFVTAAAIPHAGLTAAQAIHEVLAVRPGDVVLVHAGAGGVGTMAIQLARRAGATVLATGSERNQEYLRSLGAIPLRHDLDLSDQARAAQPGGIDVILDLIGGPGVEQTVPLLRDAGRLASTADMQIGRLGGTMVAGHPDQARLAALVADVADGTLRVHVDGTFPLDQGAAALDLVAQRHVRGKLVITMVDADSSATTTLG